MLEDTSLTGHSWPGVRPVRTSSTSCSFPLTSARTPSSVIHGIPSIIHGIPSGISVVPPSISCSVTLTFPRIHRNWPQCPPDCQLAVPSVYIPGDTTANCHSLLSFPVWHIICFTFPFTSRTVLIKGTEVPILLPLILLSVSHLPTYSSKGPCVNRRQPPSALPKTTTDQPRVSSTHLRMPSSSSRSFIFPFPARRHQLPDASLSHS